MSKSEEIVNLRKEIDELRQTLNETTRALNYVTNYLAEQSKLMAEHWYRFILWVRPFQLSAYKKPKQIRWLYRKDPSPRLPAVRDKAPNSNAAEWDRPARVFLPNAVRK
jgi:hypothetical protein